MANSYIFGQGTPWSYEQLQNKRKVAEQLMQGMSRAPRNVGEGLNAIGDALLVRQINKKAAAEEERLRGEADALWSQVSGGGDINAIAMALNNPMMGAGQKAVLTAQLQRAMEPPKPQFRMFTDAEEAELGLDPAAVWGGVDGQAPQLVYRPEVVDPREERMADIELQTAEAELAQIQSGAQSDPQVQSSEVLDDKSGVLITLKNGDVIVRSVTGEIIEGEAAIEFVREANKNYTDAQRSIYRARTEGGLDARIDKGADAAAAEQEGKKRPELALEFMDDARLVSASLTNINEAIRAIDEGAESGIVYNMLPNVTLASASLQNAMDRMGLDIIGSVTFGALSEGEMRLAMETAVPRNLRPEKLKEWLLRKKEAQEKAVDALNNAAYHFASGGTLEEHLANQRDQRQQGTQPAEGDDPLGLR